MDVRKRNKCRDGRFRNQLVKAFNLPAGEGKKPQIIAKRRKGGGTDGANAGRDRSGRLGRGLVRGLGLAPSGGRGVDRATGVSVAPSNGSSGAILNVASVGSPTWLASERRNRRFRVGCHPRLQRPPGTV